jgi:hypothetical protein
LPGEVGGQGSSPGDHPGRGRGHERPGGGLDRQATHAADQEAVDHGQRLRRSLRHAEAEKRALGDVTTQISVSSAVGELLRPDGRIVSE